MWLGLRRTRSVDSGVEQVLIGFFLEPTGRRLKCRPRVASIHPPILCPIPLSFAPKRYRMVKKSYTSQSPARDQRGPNGHRSVSN
jgi:hypothetical protein